MQAVHRPFQRGLPLCRITSSFISTRNPRASTTKRNTMPISGPHSHQKAVEILFNKLAANLEAGQHLHQRSGWMDIKDKKIWDSYCRDVCDGKLKNGDRLFEAGCGILAFLRSASTLASDLVIGGCDAAENTIHDFIPEELRESFFVGTIPNALKSVPEGSWDVVVCNSVFQYLYDEESAKQSVLEMIRIAKRWVIIADICDREYHEETQALINGLGYAQGTGLSFQTYTKSFWDQFSDNNKNSVIIRHVKVPEYMRRRERYVVYIKKNHLDCLP